MGSEYIDVHGKEVEVGGGLRAEDGFVIAWGKGSREHHIPDPLSERYLKVDLSPETTEHLHLRAVDVYGKRP